MAIQRNRSTSPAQTPTLSEVLSMQASDNERKNEASLRPNSLKEYVGQSAIKHELSVALESARLRGANVGHCLFYGPPGLGKTSLALVIAHEMNARLRHTSGPAIEKPADMLSLLTSLEAGDILFIDEIHRLRSNVEELLYSAMEDAAVDIMVGTGAGATSVRMELPRFTLVGATTRLASLSAPLRDRFVHVCKLDFYTPDELTIIADRSLATLNVPTKHAHVKTLIAERSRGTPRIVNRWVSRLRDYAITGTDLANRAACEAIFVGAGVDAEGLDALDRRVLALLANASGRAVGLSTIAASVGEDETTIEDVVEPYLLLLGFIERTPQGRRITPAGEGHIAG